MDEWYPNHNQADPLLKREEFASKLRKEKKNEILAFLREQLVFQNIQFNPSMKFLRFGEFPSDVTGALRELKIVQTTMEDTRTRTKAGNPTFRLYIRDDNRF